MKKPKKNKKVRISIIVPCYKRVQQTLKTLGLIFGSKGWEETFQGEVVVADSTRDNSLKNALLQKFKQQKARGEFFYLKPKKVGISVNKNAGAKKARSPILIFCDSDMEVEKDTILKTIKALEKHKKAGAVMGNVFWQGGSKNGQLDRPRKEDRRIKVQGTTFIEVIYSRYIATYKKVFWEVGGYDDKVFNRRGEGSDLSIRYWRAGYPLVYDPSLTVHHVADAPDSIALGVKHPEWGIAKDLWLLAYRYGNLEDRSENFAKTIGANFDKFKGEKYYRFLQGIEKYFDFIAKNRKKIDLQKKKMKVRYAFKFLEVFSDRKQLLKCIWSAEKRLAAVRKKIFD